jgi:hypothetical protein
MRKVRLTEAQLHRVIKESVKNYYLKWIGDFLAVQL